MATIEQLAARLEALEARIGPAPQAVPPVTIGELTDVPAPGSPIASQWAQEVSHRVIQRFANKAALDAWAAGNGAMAITLDNGVLYKRVTGGWSRFTSISGAAVGIGGSPVAGMVTIATITIPSDPGSRAGVLSAHCMLGVGAGGGDFQLLLDGSIQVTWRLLANQQQVAALTAHVNNITPGVAHTVTTRCTQPVTTYADGTFNQVGYSVTASI